MDSLCQAFRKKLQEAKAFAEIEGDLDKFKPSNSIKEMVRLSFAIRAKQPDVSDHLRETVMTDLMKLQEYVGGDAYQASNRADPLEQKQIDTTSGGQADTGFNNPTDQMKGKIGDGNTNKGGGMQEDIMPGLHPDVARMMAPQMGQMPPMSLPMQVKQMQYTVERMVGPLKSKISELINENSRLREAISALDKKVQETKANSYALQMPRSDGFKETTSMPLNLPNESIEDKRARIAIMDKNLSERRITI